MKYNHWELTKNYLQSAFNKNKEHDQTKKTNTCIEKLKKFDNMFANSKANYAIIHKSQLHTSLYVSKTHTLPRTVINVHNPLMFQVFGPDFNSYNSIL